MKKFMGCALALVMTVSALLTACGSAGDTAADTSANNVGDTSAVAETEATGEEEKITLKLFHNWVNVDETPYFEDIAAEFEASHPNVDIVIENVGDPDYTSKLKVMLGTDDAPDIFFSWSGEFGQKFIRAGSVLDLSEYYEADAEWKDSFIQAALVPFSNNDGIYGVPVRVDCKMMVYNKKLFEQYNVEVPTTWEEFLDVCQIFKDAGIIPLALGNLEPWASCHYISTFNGQCVPVETREADYNYSTGEFTDAGYVEALNMLKTLNDKGYFTANTNAMDFDMARNDFFIDQAAMTYMQSIEFKRCAENNVDAGVFALPAPSDAAGSKNLITGSPDGFMVSSQCEHPELAVEFLKLMTSHDWQEKMITQLSSPAAIQNVHTEENSNEVMLLAVAECAKGEGFVNWLDSDIHSKIAEVYVPGLQEILGGTKTPEELMAEVSAVAKEVQTLDEE